MRIVLSIYAFVGAATLTLAVALVAALGAGPGLLGAGGVAPGAAASAVAPATGAAPAPGTVAAVAVAWALARLGVPYRWGGTGPDGFDCSGLVQAAYAAAGVRLPRVAQDQFDAGPRLPPGAALEPGDLVFFGAGPDAVGHVGMVVAAGVMVDAPHSGATVREDRFPTTVGAAYGDERYLGASRPTSSPDAGAVPVPVVGPPGGAVPDPPS